jgi:hypothetical protein
MVCMVWTEKKKQVQKSINVFSAEGFSPPKPPLSVQLRRTDTVHVALGERGRGFG